MASIVKLWEKYSAVYISGLFGTLWISLVTVLLGTVLGMLVALLRMSRFRAACAARRYYCSSIFSG